MDNIDAPKEPVVTSYAKAPASTITAGGVSYAYRELGPKGGIPVVFELLPGSWTEKFSSNSRGAVFCNQVVHCLKSSARPL